MLKTIKRWLIKEVWIESFNYKEIFRTGRDWEKDQELNKKIEQNAVILCIKEYARNKEDVELIKSVLAKPNEIRENLYEIYDNKRGFYNAYDED